jgi:hypothetical protein
MHCMIKTRELVHQENQEPQGFQEVWTQETNVENKSLNFQNLKKT